MKIGWLLGWAVPQRWFSVFVRESFPDAEHVFISSGPDFLDRLGSVCKDSLEPGSRFDWVVGYSLGSLLLLGEAARAQRLGRVALLAPIFGFAKEEGLAGKASRAELRLMERRLRQNKIQTIEGFYRLAGLVEDRDPAGVELSIHSASFSSRAVAGSEGFSESISGGRRDAGNKRSGNDASQCSRLCTNEFGAPMPTAGDVPELSQACIEWGLERLRSIRVDPPMPEGWIGWCGTQDTLLDAARLRSLDPKIVSVDNATHHPRALIRAFAAFALKTADRPFLA